MSFKLQERDIDLYILEELHSDTGFDQWIGEQIGLQSFRCRDAGHSVSAKANAKWGETDVLAFFSDGEETVAVLIEDKIAAEFTDRQADRYHERGRDIVESGKAQRYLTMLIAPSVYLEAVPANDLWDKKIALEALRDWFGKGNTAHASWRSSALSSCISRVARSKNVANEDVLRFANEFAAFLRSQPDGPFDHHVTGDKWGFIIKPPRRRTYVQLAWKPGMRRVDLTFWGYHVGKARNFPPPEGEGMTLLLSDGKLKSDIFSIEVPMVDLSAPLEDQPEVIGEVMTAIRRLVPLIPLVLSEQVDPAGVSAQSDSAS